MLDIMLGKVFGSRNDRLLKKYRDDVKKINNLEEQISKKTNEELKDYSLSLKEKVKNGKSLNDIKIEAFAICREMSKRVLGMRHFDVQLIGGLALHDGKISEMKTGEGKTLVATLATYLNALSGNGVHLVTVNDYLAQRDALIMKPLYEALGLTVGYNISGMSPQIKKEVYENDIIYGTNSEFGFDYLKNNLVQSVEERTQKKLNFAIVDEVDSILIDEARTPLIISESDNEPSDLFIYFNNLVDSLIREKQENDGGDFFIEEEKRTIYITDNGYKKIEKLLKDDKKIENHSDMYHDIGIKYLDHINNALRAKHLYNINQHYIVKDGEVVIVDEFTGRLADGRRWSDGLHQAIEAKENVEINKESKTLATITYQNYFLLYNKLSGMTGTANTEAVEFYSIYGLETVRIPTNKDILRKDHLDIIYPRIKDKLKAITEDVIKTHKKGQPILIGTSSIENSEIVAQYLKANNLNYKILNAKYHELEAEIISQAGKLGAITIATNMAGRGTDIILGGNISNLIKEIELSELSEEDKKNQINLLQENWKKEHELVIKAGGLKVIGFEKNEARRIDNQLRGRSGRQGDPGESIFYLSLEDELFRIFGGDKFKNLISTLKLDGSAPLQNRFMTKMLNDAQIKLESANFDMRKSLIEYDSFINEQRKVFYKSRNELLESKEINEYIIDMFDYLSNDLLNSNDIREDTYPETWNFNGLKENIVSLQLYEIINQEKIDKWKNEDVTYNEVYQTLMNAMITSYNNKMSILENDFKLNIERNNILGLMDKYWQNHLTHMDRMKNFIHLRAYAQKDPKQEYKKEAHDSFLNMFDLLKIEVAEKLLKLTIVFNEPTIINEETEIVHTNTEITQDNSLDEKPSENVNNFLMAFNLGKITSRNENCPCGSGEKYKNCHGKLN